MSSTNPDIKIVQVGVRELRKVFIYPLSMTDQFTLLEKLSTEIQSIADRNITLTIKDNAKAIEFFKALISENLEKILEYVTDESERPTLNEITNNQFYDIVDTVFAANFENMIKNFKDLFQRAKGIVDVQTKATAN